MSNSTEATATTTPQTSAAVIAVARAMCKQHAAVCNVNEADAWNIHAHDFMTDAQGIWPAIDKLQTEAYAEGRKDEADENGAASKLIDAWVAAHGKAVPWPKAVEIVAIVNKLPPEERERLLALAEASK